MLEKNWRMNAKNNSNHIHNRFPHVADKVTQGDIETQHKDIGKMWAGVNTKPTQEKILRIVHGDVTGGLARYDNDVEHMRTHPLLTPNIESKRLSTADSRILDQVAIVGPTNLPAKKPRKRILQGSHSK